MTRTLVTGVAGCIGTELAAHFLRRGDHVTGLDLREPDTPELTTAETFDFGECDLTSESAVDRELGGRLANDGPYDVVVNNVGLIYSALVVQMADGRVVSHSFDDWRRVLDVTLSAAFYVTASCAKSMVESSTEGVFVNISSVSAHGNRGQAAYSAAKAGINAMTISIAKELGPFGIRVAAIAPGFIDTPSTRSSVSEGQLDRTIKSVPLGRLGTVSEVIDAVQFVVDNGYFHGKVLELDGGLTL